MSRGGQSAQFHYFSQSIDAPGEILLRYIMSHDSAVMGLVSRF